MCVCVHVCVCVFARGAIIEPRREANWSVDRAASWSLSSGVTLAPSEGLVDGRGGDAKRLSVKKN